MSNSQGWVLVGVVITLLVAMGGMVLRVVQTEIRSVRVTLESVVQRLDRIETRLDRIELQVLADHGERIARLEAR